MNVHKKFNDIIKDMRDNNLNIRKRGVSLEETSVKLLYESLHIFRNILDSSKDFDVDKAEMIRKFEVAYEIMEDKFDTIESMLKDANVEYWERFFQEKEIKGNKCKYY